MDVVKRVVKRLALQWLVANWRRSLYLGLVAGMAIGWLVMVLVRAYLGPG
jgi:hypothetical protein